MGEDVKAIHPCGKEDAARPEIYTLYTILYTVRGGLDRISSGQTAPFSEILPIPEDGPLLKWLHLFTFQYIL